MKKDQLMDKASATAQSAKESCQQGMDNASSAMQQVLKIHLLVGIVPLMTLGMEMDQAWA